jgi:phosphatidylserine/phosphatidylglycerophosphate/cardiolipin synthase-like enzyme
VIENPYVVLTKEMIQALREAGQRGVQILLGTNSPTSTDSTVTQAFFLKDWPRLEATIPNLRIFVATGERKLHAKVAVVDDVLTLVGTYNMDFISERVNSELATLVWSPEFADQASAGIARDKSEERNGVVEYRILRDGQGNPIRSDGKPVLDDQGNLVNEPEVAYGPEDHVPTRVLAEYRQRISRWSFLRRFLPQLRPLDTFRQTLRD